MEQTLVLLKPDALQRKLVGELISRFEHKGLEIVDLRLLYMSTELARCHYQQLVHEKYFPQIEEYITSGPLIAMILEGREAIDVVRRMIGVTDGTKAMPGTIRGDYTLGYRRNLVHASDSPESAAREINLFFPSSRKPRS